MLLKMLLISSVLNFFEPFQGVRTIIFIFWTNEKLINGLFALNHRFTSFNIAIYILLTFFESNQVNQVFYVLLLTYYSFDSSLWAGHALLTFKYD